MTRSSRGCLLPARTCTRVEMRHCVSPQRTATPRLPHFCVPLVACTHKTGECLPTLLSHMGRCHCHRAVVLRQLAPLLSERRRCRCASQQLPHRPPARFNAGPPPRQHAQSALRRRAHSCALLSSSAHRRCMSLRAVGSVALSAIHKAAPRAPAALSRAAERPPVLPAPLPTRRVAAAPRADAESFLCDQIFLVYAAGATHCRASRTRCSARDAGGLRDTKRLRSLVGSIFIPPRLVLTAPVLSQRWRARRGSRCGRCCRRPPWAPTPGRGASAARGAATTTARTTPCWRTPTEPRHERKPRRCIKSNTCVTFRRFLVSLAHSCCSSRLRTSLLRNVAQRGALRRLLRRLGRLCELRRHAR